MGLLWLLLVPLPLLVGVYLIWQHSGILRVLGWLILFVLVYQGLMWISPSYVIRGRDRVQVFKLSQSQMGAFPWVRWMDAPSRLLLVPDTVKFFPEGPQVLVADLKTRQTHWQPKAELNLDDTKVVMFSNEGYLERDSNSSVYYASPSKVGPLNKYSFVGFSLPRLVYNIPNLFSEASGWEVEKTYFGWTRIDVRESEFSPVVVELNQIVLNAPPELIGASTKWLPGGKFLIVEPPTYIDPRVFALEPFNTSQDTQSKGKEKE